ncbi:MAG: type pilus assembly protein PilM [Gaiellaceae bacterium]|nr:type pilus assembly protein PilM [Gaiellaceae bacterium]
MSNDEKPTSIWKKELSFKRNAEQDSSDAAGGTAAWQEEQDHTPSLEVPTEPDPIVFEALEAVPEPAPEPAVDPVVEAEPTPAVPTPVLPVEHDWLTQPLEEVSAPPAEPSPITLVPAIEQPAPVLAPAPDPEPELPPVAETPAPALPVPPAPVAAPVLPDVVLELPTVELPAPALPVPVAPAAAKAAKAPFYKRELSFKRTKGDRSDKVEAEAGEKRPFYKRELSLKRKARQWDAAEPAVEAKPKLNRLPRPKPSLSRGGGNAKSVVGLKIGGSQIAAARINNSNGSHELVQAVREPLEQGIVVGGELRDPEALALALKDFFARHKLPKRAVRLGIANNRIGVRTFDVLGIDDPKQLANAIRFRAQEVLPIPIEEAVLDYQVLSESVNAEGQPVRRVLLVVAYRELVDRYVYACRKAGIQVVGIDLEAFALLRAVSEPHDPVPGSERGAVVAVSVGHDRSTFAVSDGRVCEFTRVLEWGGAALNVAIARELDISPSEAEPLKRGLSLNGVDEAPAGFSPDQLATAREAARRQLQTFARELVSSLQFYQNQPGSLGIGEIALTGGTAHLPGLGAELERLIGVPVRVADPMARLKVSKKVREFDQVGSLAIAIGLGIDD